MSCALTLQTGMLVLHSPQSREQQYMDVASAIGPHIQYGGQQYEASIKL